MAGIADSLIVRAAGDADLPVLTVLLAQLREPGTEAPTPSEAAALLARIQGSTHHRIYVAETVGAVVGAYALLIMDSLAHPRRPAAVVEDLVVDVSCRGQGIGRRLIEDALARAAARGCYKLALSSNLRRDAAHRFYERLGFERHGYSFAVFLERG
jgi:ribosomal protein S18 acetylase RimI-like enzyme